MDKPPTTKTSKGAGGFFRMGNCGKNKFLRGVLIVTRQGLWRGDVCQTGEV
jgi:hypothetical protein